jgi:D-alanyl-D-alanine carboxypeptidase
LLCQHLRRFLIVCDYLSHGATLGNKKVFDFGLNDPGKIEIHDGAKTYLLTKGGEDWWSADGKKVDRTSAEALVDKLRNLQATDFADSGFGNTLIDITVTQNDGKRLEKVLFSKANKRPLAKRESEPSLYVLDSSVVEDLQKLVNDLKTNPTSGN